MSISRDGDGLDHGDDRPWCGPVRATLTFGLDRVGTLYVFDANGDGTAEGPPVPGW